jgi:competence protein ComEC
MQNSSKIWRASNPLFLVSAYMLLGLILFHASKPYIGMMQQPLLLWTVIGSLFVVYLSAQSNFFPSIFQLLPALVLVFWGACIGSFSANTYLFSVLYNSDWINQVRQLLLYKLDDSFRHPVSNAFAKTLLFGTKSQMSEQLTNAYQALGILHIIAISGMHLDIVFGLLEKGTNWIPLAFWFRLFKLILLLFLAWTYTCIAHAGPSIVRASLFFSLIVLGRFFKFNLFSFNTISAGIVLVLLYNSHIISSIGLQLSYAAVIGIYFFYKPLSLLVPLDNILLKILWNNLALSIAAQLTTLPILLYYFHNNSSLSIIGNFLFVPASNILLYGLILFMVMPTFFGITQTIAHWMHLYIETMNGMIQYLHLLLQIGERSYSMGLAGLIYYYFCLFAGYYWVQYKAPNTVLVLLTGTCLYSLVKLFSI